MYLNTDRQPGFLQIRYSDDDYQTWSNFRQVDLSVKKPQISDEGTFDWRRAYHYRWFEPLPFRASTADLQMDIGTL